MGRRSVPTFSRRNRTSPEPCEGSGGVRQHDAHVDAGLGRPSSVLARLPLPLPTDLTTVTRALVTFVGIPGYRRVWVRPGHGRGSEETPYSGSECGVPQGDGRGNRAALRSVAQLLGLWIQAPGHTRSLPGWGPQGADGPAPFARAANPSEQRVGLRSRMSASHPQQRGTSAGAKGPLGGWLTTCGSRQWWIRVVASSVDTGLPDSVMSEP
jgi:hypothetical protein